MIIGQHLPQCPEVDHLKFRPDGPFHFRLTFWKPSHFPTQLEIHSTRTSWRTFQILGSAVGVRFDTDNATVRARVFTADEYTPAHRAVLNSRILVGYGLQDSLDSFYASFDAHPVLAPVIRKLHGMRSSCPENLFEISVLSVILQNTTVQRSQQMLSNLLRLYGREMEFDGVQLSCFLGPEALAQAQPEKLREMARVGYRDKTLVAIGQHFASAFIPEVSPSTAKEEIVEDVLRIRGIGPYSAGVIASSILRDTAAFGLDVWNNKILSKALFGTPDVSKDLVAASCLEEFGPFAGQAVEYLVEGEYIHHPVCPIYFSDDDARAASHQWPRPPYADLYPGEDLD